MSYQFEDAVRSRTEEQRQTIRELREDLDSAQNEIDKLTEQNKLVREACISCGLAISHGFGCPALTAIEK